MKLHRISLQEFRKFRDPVVLDDLSAGLNVIAGPNEAGKSTVAAAIRAAFLERYKTTKVADLAPWGMSGARPSVEIAFEHDGHEYVLRKSFLTRARCELLIDDGVERHEGEAAENALAALLGFEFSAKGNSRPEHGGIPGLLWIAQGEGQNLLEPAGHAQSHVREALTRLTGELTSADGDSLYERVEAERATLRDGRSGRPKGAYKDAEDTLARAEQAVATLTASKQALDADVDRLALLRRDYDKAQQEQPWLSLEQRAAQARTRLTEISREREALGSLQRELAQAEDTLTLLHEQVDRDQRDAEALRVTRVQADTAAASVAPAREALERALQHQQHIAERLAQANAQLAAAQQTALRQDCLVQIARLNQELRNGLNGIRQAERLTEQVQTLQATAAGLEIDDRALRMLRDLEQRLTKLQIQQSAGATRVSHRLLAGQTLLLADQTLTGEGEALVTQASELQIPGVGVLRIEPGGSDLPTILTALQQVQAERAAVLSRLSVATLAEAEARAASYEQVRRDLDIARQTLRVQAPEGIDALRAAHTQTQSRLQQLQKQLAAFSEVSPAPPRADTESIASDSAGQPHKHAVASEASGRAGTESAVSGVAHHADKDSVVPGVAGQAGTHSVVSDAIGPAASGPSGDIETTAPLLLAQAQQALQIATVEAEHAGQAVTAARTALDTQQTTAQIFQAQWAARQAEFDAAPRVEQREQRGVRLVEARATRDTLAQRYQAAQAALQALHPELIEQDAQRFEQSARLQREEQQRRHAELLQLQGKLEQAQAHGLGEQLLQAQAEAQRLARRRDEFATRAQALDMLWQLLGERRADATQRLLEPLAQRLRHYVGLLFPGAQWRLDEALMPAAVVRGAGPDAAETLNALSFGTREQLGVLARFAYADLLQQAGRPTLLVLDDTLVHADQDRRELMKRALYDAASRHQVLLLTCHGESWQDMGVGVRAVP